MQRLTTVRYTTTPEGADENIRLSRAVFDEVRANAPEGVAYALFRDGDEFIHVFVNRNEDNSDVVTELPTFHAFSESLPARCVVPPAPDRRSVELIDSYGMTA